MASKDYGDYKWDKGCTPTGKESDVDWTTGTIKKGKEGLHAEHGYDWSKGQNPCGGKK